MKIDQYPYEFSCFWGHKAYSPSAEGGAGEKQVAEMSEISKMRYELRVSYEQVSTYSNFSTFTSL